MPALNITGWWDMNFPGSWMNYEGMRTQGQTEAIRDSQRLLIGPWPHRGNLVRALGSGGEMGRSPPSFPISLGCAGSAADT